MKKIGVVCFLALISVSTFGQNGIPDSLIYFLVEHSVTDVQGEKLFKYPTLPKISFTEQAGVISEYFKSEDSSFIKQQTDKPLQQK